ncbi:(2S)-3-sulfopropanediol dehydratase activating enzyme [Desulfovibrio litoralis]|uniref:Pyruvate formate lyase activating enzyme n=1 Tax=Desulfovibrio litoralis DSM 11393 TaxID=1121455 RepID=A0A1M7RRU5_9BACT|nr:glycyl-radical enzyme activating protein [Desulfovibrio litoralis]SHN48979.1 pyruvate formate lyase activating enzyme [Desulfovibrio litoralis DSM 11393]
MLDKNQKGIVFNIQKFSVHDGKGIRTLVFLKGCPLKCKWCSNPESQKLAIEKAYNPMRCLSAEICGRCVQSCSFGTIQNIDGLLFNDFSKCQSCFKCANACPSGAQTVYGEEMTVDQVLRRVEEDGVFYSRSGGGLTLSGGEVLMQPEFVNALLREAKVRHINAVIETCGHYPYKRLAEACQYLQTLIYDIKSLSSEKHKEFTGVGNKLILENFKKVCEDFPNLKILVRTPVVPGFNNTQEDIIAIRNFLPKTPNISYELLEYHRMGEPKYSYLGRNYEMHGKALAPQEMETLKQLII